ncbi:lipid II:glycine glycyltransferase FemX [Peterkaempfera sp. SMS 1(5)a]|uniref:lipid II:glycine glycyltransferase FemX n=1 Tax=Peterkaempfera podocarpi TaxID=3232308 RepID=UPI00366AF3CD
MSLRLSTISREEHLAYIEGLPSASHMQVPAWGGVKAEWRPESIGWFDEQDRLVGVGLVLYRQLPKLKRFLAYMPEGPVINWFDPDLERWLQPMLAHLKGQGAFSVKMGPPVVIRRWHAETIKQAIAGKTAKRLRDVEASAYEPRAFEVVDRLRRMGWLQNEDEDGGGFSAGQPRYVFQVPMAGRAMDDVLRGMNQQWRRNIKKSEKAGVQVHLGRFEDLAIFHELYKETGERDHFIPRPLSYFQGMWKALNSETPDSMRLYLASHEGEVLAATTMLRTGSHVWYSYGASTVRKREVQSSNAVQWQMMRDAHAMGAHVYDLRGISDTLDEDNHLFGLIRFKVGTGGQAAEYLGEWDFPLSKVLQKAFDMYMTSRAVAR